jgi:hypothetical protein
MADYDFAPPRLIIAPRAFSSFSLTFSLTYLFQVYFYYSLSGIFLLFLIWYTSTIPGCVRPGDTSVRVTRPSGRYVRPGDAPVREMRPSGRCARPPSLGSFGASDRTLSAYPLRSWVGESSARKGDDLGNRDSPEWGCPSPGQRYSALQQ